MDDRERNLRQAAEHATTLDVSGVRWAAEEIDRLRVELRSSQGEVSRSMLEEMDRLRGEVSDLKLENGELKRKAEKLEWDDLNKTMGRPNP